MTIASKTIFGVAAFLAASFFVGGGVLLSWCMGALIIVATLGLFVYFLFFV